MIKKIIITALCLSTAGCNGGAKNVSNEASNPVMLQAPVVNNKLSQSERINAECIKATGKPCTDKYKGKTQAQIDADYDKQRQELTDSLEGTGKHANDKLINAINDQTRQTNNNLMWMRIEQQNLINGLSK